MAQPKLDIISIDVSRRIGDEVTSSNADGNTITAAQRLKAINDARDMLYTQKLESLGLDDFIRLYPEFVALSTYLAITSNTVTKPADCKLVLEMTCFQDVMGTKNFHSLPKHMTQKNYHDALYNTFSRWKATAGKPKFAEFESTVKLVATVTDYTDAILNYLKQPVDIAGYGGSNADLFEPEGWHEEIKRIASEIILLGNQEI